ncbi:MAG: hypothetical protein HY744_10840 [Deltaproteobacteria bacterium]|nr:hypothetical protein [Deltaproteobacteria bacterium]
MTVPRPSRLPRPGAPRPRVALRAAPSAAALFGLVLQAAPSAGAGAAGPAPKPAAARAAGQPGELDPDLAERYRRLTQPGGAYGRLFTTLAFGTGLRFNNPYRLRTQLGETAESLSLTAPYANWGVGMCFGPPDGLQHGGSVQISVALAGVAQQALSAAYLAVYRGPYPLLAYGRLGAALVAAPDANAGAELGGGVAYFVTGALGLTAELVGNLFYGAGTYETAYAVYPVLSAQLGVVADLEVLP